MATVHEPAAQDHQAAPEQIALEQTGQAAPEQTAREQTSQAPATIAPRTVFEELHTWQPRRWWFAVATSIATVILVAIPTALIPNPWFTREIPVTPWAWPVLLVTSVLAGLVAATYVARKDIDGRGGALGTTGAIAGFFAVGCPVCNKLVLLALGYTGALQFFEPLQPFLAGGSILLLGSALVLRVSKERSCPLPTS